MLENYVGERRKELLPTYYSVHPMFLVRTDATSGPKMELNLLKVSLA